MGLAAVTRPELLASTEREGVATLVAVSNWALVTSHAPVGLLSHTWSLAIEEQFYLTWPLVLVLLLRRGGRRVALAGALAAVVAITVHRLSVAGVESAFRTDTRADSLLVGCALALLVAGGALARVSKVLVWAWALVAVFLLGMVARVVGDASALPAVYSLIALASAALIVAAAVRPTPLVRWLGSAPLIWLGRRSYGVYLYHLPIYLALVAPRLGSGPVALVVTAVLSLTVAAVSFRYLETPCLDLKGTVPRRIGAVRTDGER